MAFVAKISCVGPPKQLLLRQLVVSYLRRVNFGDAIDNFTVELVNKRQLKWSLDSPLPVPSLISQRDLHLVKKSTQQLLKEINAIYDSVLSVDVRKLQDDQLENLFRNSMDDGNKQDLNYLVNECMKWNTLPTSSTELIVDILKFYENSHQLENLEKLYDFCLVLLLPNVFPLRLFKVKFYWAEGNIDKSLSLLEEIHDVARKTNDENSGDLISCKDTFLFLIEDAVGKKSEAVLLKLIHLIETVDDVSILERVWNELFTSQWFSDQQLALGLFRRHSGLRLRLSVQTNYVTFLLLRDHNVDAVYRLVELLLAHEMMHECQKVLGLLFDYQFWRKDLRTCSEIVQTCISLDIPLDPNYGRKLVMLLLAPKQQPPIASKARNAKKSSPPTVELKF